MLSQKAFVYALAGGVFITASAVAGPEWVEQGDAGSLVPTAQKTYGSGSLLSISGSLSSHLSLGSVDYEDMYLITVLNPTIFSMKILDADFDAQLFIFNITLPGEGFGLLANNDTVDGNAPEVGNHATDGTGSQLLLPGKYAIAISGLGRIPISLSGPIFFFGNSTEVSGADGPGGIHPIIDWSGEGQVGSYTILLIGSGPSDVPAPGALALLALAASLARRRRRRSS